MITNVLNEEELITTLNEFRDVLLNYDYSEVDNVVFLNLEALNAYIKSHKNNPFERQYDDLEKLFTKIMPFIPSNIPEEAIEAIKNILKSRYNDEELIDKNIKFNIKMDFIQTVKSITTNEEWQQLIELCRMIFRSKEHYLTH